MSPDYNWFRSTVPLKRVSSSSFLLCDDDDDDGGGGGL